MIETSFHFMGSCLLMSLLHNELSMREQVEEPCRRSGDLVLELQLDASDISIEIIVRRSHLLTARDR